MECSRRAPLVSRAVSGLSNAAALEPGWWPRVRPCRWLALRLRRLLLLISTALLVTVTLYSGLTHLDVLLAPSHLYPPPRRLVDLRRFRYLLNTDVCGAEPVTAVLLVHSNPRRPRARLAVRRSLPQRMLRRLRVRRVFMLADASGPSAEGGDVVTPEVILQENRDHFDLVQGNFFDSYHNMTYKHVMALDWAVTFCPQAKWLVKMDDDTLVDVFSLLEELQTLPSRDFLGGNLNQLPRPYRGQVKKWSVPLSVWPHEYYPPYLSGGLYLATQDVAKKLLQQTTKQPFFWIDDVYVTGILAAQLDIPLTGLNRLFVTEARCADDAVSQVFRLDRQSAAPVYAPSFVVSITQKNFTVLERFNLLTRYCFRFPCGRRDPHKDCFNRIRLKPNNTTRPAHREIAVTSDAVSDG